MQIINPTVAPDEVRELQALARDQAALELGAGFGYSTVELCAVAREVWSVDWHQGDPQAGSGQTAAGYLERTAEWRDRLRLIVVVGRFAQVLPRLRPASFDLIFHDGYHTAEAVAADLRMALPLLRWGGYIACHDYGLFGVKQGSESVLGPPDRVTQRLAVWGPSQGRWHT